LSSSANDEEVLIETRARMAKIKGLQRETPKASVAAAKSVGSGA
jgi:hypothetical protein